MLVASQRTHPALAASMALGALITVGYAVSSLGRPLWLDESYTLAAVNFPGLSLVRTNGTMGLYYVLMWGWGQAGLANWWLRLPSVLFALASLFVLRAIAGRMGRTQLAVLAVPLLALVPMFQHKAVEARSYSLETLLVCTCWYLALRAVEAEGDDDLRWWLALLPVSVAGVFAHGLFLVHLAPILVVALVGPRPTRAVLRAMPAFVAAGAIALVLLVTGSSAVGTTTVGGPRAWASRSFDTFFPGPPWAALLLLVTCLAGAGIATVRAVRAPTALERARWAVPGAWMVVPGLALGVISLASPHFNPRYLVPIAPGMALAAAVGIHSVLTARSRQHPVRRTAPLAVAALVAVAAAASLAATPFPIAEDWRGAAAIVSDGARPDDALLFANATDEEPQQHRPPFEAAWAEASPEVSPVVVSSPRGLGPVRRYEEIRAPAEMAAAARSHPRLWVVDRRGNVGADVILAHPGFRELRLVERWDLQGGIQVSLYHWGE